jgi:hypothetical protein
MEATMDPRYRIFDRYQRLRHRSTGDYVNAVAPGPTPDTILIAHKTTLYPASRAGLRPLRWYERLLNR